MHPFPLARGQRIPWGKGRGEGVTIFRGGGGRVRKREKFSGGKVD